MKHKDEVVRFYVSNFKRAGCFYRYRYENTYIHVHKIHWLCYSPLCSPLHILHWISEALQIILLIRRLCVRRYWNIKISVAVCVLVTKVRMQSTDTCSRCILHVTAITFRPPHNSTRVHAHYSLDHQSDHSPRYVPIQWSGDCLQETGDWGTL